MRPNAVRERQLLSQSSAIMQGLPAHCLPLRLTLEQLTSVCSSPLSVLVYENRAGGTYIPLCEVSLDYFLWNKS